MSATAEQTEASPVVWDRAPPQETVPCHGCGTMLPLDLVKRCPICIGAGGAAGRLTQMEQRAEKGGRASVEMVERMVSLAKGDGSSANIVLLVEDLIDQMGGTHGAACRWLQIIDRALESGSVMAGLKAMKDLAHVLIAVAPKMERKIDYREMSDDELEQDYNATTVREAMLKLACDQPEAAPFIEKFLAKAESFETAHDDSSQAAAQSD